MVRAIFGINYPRDFWKFWNWPIGQFQNFQKCTRAIYPKPPSQTCVYQYILNINFEKISFINFFIIFFYRILIKLRSIFDLLKIIYWKLLQHCPTLQIIYIPTLKTLNIWWFFTFIIIFHVFIISFCISINRVTYSSSNTFFWL